MKPRNRYEKAVLEASRRLRPIGKRVKEWAFRECIDHFAYRLPKGRTACMDCGHSWIMDEPTEHCTCPHCGASLKVENTFRRKLVQKQYFTMLTTSEEYQVLRMFLLVSSMEKGTAASSYFLEIGHYWWNAEGKMAVIAIKRVYGVYIDTFSFFTPMAVRRDNEAYSHVAYAPIYPKFKTIEALRRNGFEGSFYNIVPTRFISALLSDSHMETLLKSGQIPLFKYFVSSGGKRLGEYWASVKICLRNGYFVEDGCLWCDMVAMLGKLGKDVRNRKFVCPDDLSAAHDRCESKMRVLREREYAERREREAREAEKAFSEQKSKFFGMEFTDGEIRIRVLESVREYLEEGTAMHHCVYESGYYRRPQSLIFSATKDGKRIETVEVSLETLTVVQSRGACNKNTEYHERILALMQRNMKQIENRLTA